MTKTSRWRQLGEATSRAGRPYLQSKPALKRQGATQRKVASHFPVRGAAVAALSLALGLTIASTACTVGPNYRRPVVSAPGSYRGAVTAPPAPATTTGASAATAPAPAFGDESWATVFQDPELQGLIRTALRQNFDVRIAAARVAEAQAQLGVTRGDQFPSAGVDASGAASRNARSKFNTAYTTSNVELGVGFQWNLDFWGKYRRATEAARDQLLATDWAQRAVASSLVANLAAAYYGLRAQDLELAIAQRTLAADLDSLKLTQLLADNGATSMLDVRQAQELVAAAGAAIPLAQKQIAQQENLISILLGENPGAVGRGLGLDQQPHPPQVPAGLPSALLERRPDIREAEAQLMAVNARIGVAKAAYFPAIALTGSAGTQSLALGQLFGGPTGAWSFAGQLLQPLFAAGSLKNGVRLAQAQRQEAVLDYQQTVQQAFREVSDALVSYTQDQAFRQQQQALDDAAQDAAHLSALRYQGGAASYLEVLDSNTRAYAAQVTLAQATLNELLDYVSLYRALGGGWQ